MIDKDRVLFIQRTWSVVPVLFIFLLFLQILDAHSTISSGAGHYESNKAINWLISWVGFTTAVCITKAWSAIVLLILYRVWRLSNGSHNREFVVSLTLISLIYSFVVANNYLS
jgi:hypothetical protein